MSKKTASRKRLSAGSQKELTTANVDEYSVVWHLAHERLKDANDDQKLKWLFDFLKTDLSKLSMKEQKIYGECLRSLQDEYQSEGSSSFLMGEELAAYQKTIFEGIRTLFDKKEIEWPIPPPKEMSLWRMTPLSKPARFQFILRGDERAAILYGAVELLRKLPGRLRACGYCLKPILRSKRQEYCDEKCSRAQREKNRQDRREQMRLQTMLTKLNVVNSLPGDPRERQSYAELLRAKLTAAKSMDAFWKDVTNGTEVVLRRFLTMKGRKPREFR